MYSLRCFSLKRQLPFSQVCTFTAQAICISITPAGIRPIAKRFLMDGCHNSAAGWTVTRIFIRKGKPGGERRRKENNRARFALIGAAALLFLLDIRLESKNHETSIRYKTSHGGVPGDILALCLPAHLYVKASFWNAPTFFRQSTSR